MSTGHLDCRGCVTGRHSFRRAFTLVMCAVDVALIAAKALS